MNDHDLAVDIVRRDRSRVRLLAAASISLWVLTGLLIPSLFLPMWAKVSQQADVLDQAAAATPPVTAAQVAGIVSETARVAVKASAMMITIAIAASLLESVVTVALALTIRRATLRHVASGLAEVSEQLRELQRATQAGGVR
jgi:hypothetical protein